MSNIRDKMILGIISFLLLTLIAGAVIFAVRTIQNKPVEITITPSTPPEYVYQVNISGAVVNPGLYRIKEKDTVISLLYNASLAPDANTESIRIYVPKNNEAVQPQKINLNTAELWLLETLPGIGPGKAQKIIDFRQQNGPFQSPYDLLKVDGIGKATYDGLKDYITIGE